MNKVLQTQHTLLHGLLWRDC